MSIQSIPDFPAPKRVLLAAPRGYCAGVDRAIEIVEVALATYGAPVPPPREDRMTLAGDDRSGAGR